MTKRESRSKTIQDTQIIQACAMTQPGDRADCRDGTKVVCSSSLLEKRGMCNHPSDNSGNQETGDDGEKTDPEHKFRGQTGSSRSARGQRQTRDNSNEQGDAVGIRVA